MTARIRFVSCIVFGIVASLGLIAYTQGPADGPTAAIERETQAAGRKDAEQPPASSAAAEPAEVAQRFYKCIGQSDSPTVPKIEKALRSPLHSGGLVYSDKPLQLIANELQIEYGIPILLDKAALDTAGLRDDEPVTINLRGVSLRSGLRLMLRNLNLTYVVVDGVLMITTPEEEERRFVLCVYDVRDLVDADGGRPLDVLVEVLEGAIDEMNETWDGEQPSIRALKPGTLIVSSSQSLQEEFRELLTAIRDANREPISTTSQSHSPTAVSDAAPNSSK